METNKILFIRRKIQVLVQHTLALRLTCHFKGKKPSSLTQTMQSLCKKKTNEESSKKKKQFKLFFSRNKQKL